jgi:hypothetical protein
VSGVPFALLIRLKVAEHSLGNLPRTIWMPSWRRWQSRGNTDSGCGDAVDQDLRAELLQEDAVFRPICLTPDGHSDAATGRGE